MKSRIPTPLGALAPALLLALAGCQSVPPENPDLIAARGVVEQAGADSDAARAGAVELERARQALRRAEMAWNDQRNVEDTRHLAYLATKRAEIAIALGAQARADDRLKQAGVERDRMRLEARTREAENATRRANAAQASAEAARADASAALASVQVAQSQAEQARQQAVQESERAAALEHDLLSLRARETQRGVVVTLGDVLFATGKATLQPGAQRTVDRLAAVLQRYPERRVLIEGYTDDLGSREFNLDLSQRRAEAFRAALLAAGVDGTRIEVRGHGQDSPVADNGTPEGRQLNRRVEIVFSDGQGRFAQI